MPDDAEIDLESPILNTGSEWVDDVETSSQTSSPTDATSKQLVYYESGATWADLVANHHKNLVTPSVSTTTGQNSNDQYSEPFSQGTLMTHKTEVPPIFLAYK